MGLMLKTQRDGKLRADWYGLYTDQTGRRRVVNLNVRWAGNPPESGSLMDEGDKAFERSRDRAEAALTAYMDEARRKGRAEHLTERLIESKTGRAMQYLKIEDLPTRWRTLGREDGPPTERYLRDCDAKFRRFAEFMLQRNPKTTYLYEVTAEDAAAFAEACRSVLATGTAKDSVRLLGKALGRFLPVGAANPFDAFIGRKRKGGNGDAGVIHRKPFSAVELDALLNAAREDGFMYPLVICAALTGMRRGDVCNLKWSSVDLAAGMLMVKTSKTEAEVQVPVFPPLRRVLMDAGGKGKGYVWPAAARMLRENPDGLTWRFKKIVARAFGEVKPLALPALSPAEVETKGAAAIQAHVEDHARRERLLDVLRRYCAGQGIRTIERELDVARTAISRDLHLIEGWIGLPFMRKPTGPGLKSEVKKLTRQEREKGQRAASVRDWHALRTTWVTVALQSGVPMDVVRLVTGHATVDIVLKYYFKPDREAFRQILTGALPAVLTGETGRKTKRLTAANELAELVNKVQTGTATATDRKRLRVLAATV
jgi:integrase